MEESALGDNGEVTRLLGEIGRGQKEAVNDLLPLVYDELHRLARSYFRRERGEHTMQPTALVHEAYIRLVDQRAPLESRGHFMAVAATQMRRILLDYARKHRAARRGGDGQKVLLEDTMAICEQRPVDMILLDSALEKLAVARQQAGASWSSCASSPACRWRKPPKSWAFRPPPSSAAGVPRAPSCTARSPEVPLTPQRWAQIRQIFDGALERPAKDRAAYLRVLCARDEELRREVESLLRSHEQSDEFLETPAAQLSQIVFPADDDISEYPQGYRVGPYQFERRIGRGGMGAVWLATRFDKEYQESRSPSRW